jgi:hypothetical protein
VLNILVLSPFLYLAWLVVDLWIFKGPQSGAADPPADPVLKYADPLHLATRSRRFCMEWSNYKRGIAIQRPEYPRPGPTCFRCLSVELFHSKDSKFANPAFSWWSANLFLTVEERPSAINCFWSGLIIGQIMRLIAVNTLIRRAYFYHVGAWSYPVPNIPFDLRGGAPNRRRSLAAGTLEKRHL